MHAYPIVSLYNALATSYSSVLFHVYFVYFFFFCFFLFHFIDFFLFACAVFVWVSFIISMVFVAIWMEYARLKSFRYYIALHKCKQNCSVRKNIPYFSYFTWIFNILLLFFCDMILSICSNAGSFLNSCFYIFNFFPIFFFLSIVFCCCCYRCFRFKFVSMALPILRLNAIKLTLFLVDRAKAWKQSYYFFFSFRSLSCLFSLSCNKIMFYVNFQTTC